jgi:hypothetical protein
MVRGGNHKAVRIILLNHLQKTVHDTTHFANVVAETAGGADAVEFVEEIESMPRKSAAVWRRFRP